MFQISAALQSQFFAHSVTWTILRAKGKVAGELDACLADLNVEVWPKVVYVHLKKNVLRQDCPWGVSTLISYKEYLEQAIALAFSKAQGLEVFPQTNELYRVRSQSQPNERHFIKLYSDYMTCSCEDFRCLNNRIWTETPYLRALIRFHKVLNGQIPCHHVVAVLKSFNFTNFKDFFTERTNIPQQTVNESPES